MTKQTSLLPGVNKRALAADPVFENGGWNQTVWLAAAGQPVRDATI